MAPQRPRTSGNNPARRPNSNQAGKSPYRSKSSGPGSSRPASADGRRPGGASPKPPRRPSGPARPKPAGPRREADSPSSERLQKILAHAGVGSRRACEELILQGRVTAGGQVIRELGTKVDPARTPVAVDGQKVQVERPVYFAVYKPKGYVSTNDDPSGRPRVLDLLPEIPQRVYTVGRLDEMSVGLMLLTNDGDLANKLAHPRYGVEKLYRVVVAGSPAREVLSQLVEGIWLAEGKVRAKSVRAVGTRGDSTILELVLAEGKNREVRRMLAKLGHKVMMLTRVAVGPITIKGLTAGQFRPLTGREVDLLRRVADGQSVPMPWMTDRKPRREPERPRRPEGGPRPGSGSSRNGSRPDARGNQGGPPRRPEGPRTSNGPMFRSPSGAIMPQHPGVRPSERPGADRRPGPRPDGPPRGYTSGRRDRDDGPPRNDGPRSYREEGPRPPRQGGSRPDRNDGPRPPRQDGPRSCREEGPRPPRQGGPRPDRNDGPRPLRQDGPRSYREDGPRPPRQGGPRPDRNDGPRPPRQDGPRTYREDGPRPPRQTSSPGQDRRQQGGGPGRPAGPRPYRPDGPRPPARAGDDRRPGGRDRDGGSGQDRRGPGDGPPRPNGPRSYQSDGPRPSNRGRDDRPNGPRPTGPPRPPGARRPAPPATREPNPRRVIGMDRREAAPRPAPSPPPEVSAPSGRDDRPSPRTKRPTGKRPATRPGGAAKPMPKARKGGRRPQED